MKKCIFYFKKNILIFLVYLKKSIIFVLHKYNTMQKKTKIIDGQEKVAVIFSGSPYYGWHTWNPRFPELLFHPTIVDAVENKTPINEDFIVNVLLSCGYSLGTTNGLGISSGKLFSKKDLLLNAVPYLDIRWVNKGTYICLIPIEAGGETLYTEQHMQKV